MGGDTTKDPWQTFSPLSSPPTRAELDTLYAEAIARIADSENWYKVRMPRHERASYVSRGIGVAALGLGLLLPNLAAGFGGSASLVWFGYGAVLLGGFVIVLDQTFLWSRSHARYATAWMAIRSVRTQVQYDWAILRSSIIDDAGAASKADAAMAFLRDAEASVGRLVTEETGTWSTQLSQAMTDLISALNTRRSDVVAEMVRDKAAKAAADKTAAEKADADKVDAAKKAAADKQTAAVNISINALAGTKGLATIAVTGVGSDASQERSLPTSLAYPAVKVGSTIKVHVEAAAEGDGHRVVREHVHTVVAGTNAITIA